MPPKKRERVREFTSLRNTVSLTDGHSSGLPSSWLPSLSPDGATILNVYECPYAFLHPEVTWGSIFAFAYGPDVTPASAHTFFLRARGPQKMRASLG